MYLMGHNNVPSSNAVFASIHSDLGKLFLLLAEFGHVARRRDQLLEEQEETSSWRNKGRPATGGLRGNQLLYEQKRRPVTGGTEEETSSWRIKRRQATGGLRGEKLLEEPEKRPATGEIQSLQELNSRRAITMTAYTFFGCAFTAYGETGVHKK